MCEEVSRSSARLVRGGLLLCLGHGRLGNHRAYPLILKVKLGLSCGQCVLNTG